MKRFVLTIFVLIICGNSLFAQESSARRAFAAGDYDAAVKFYQAAVATVSDHTAKDSLTQKISIAKTCAAISRKAKHYYNAGNYAEARRWYRTLSSYNSSDANIRSYIERCDYFIKNIAAREAEKKKRDAAYTEALTSGNVALFRLFAETYVDDEMAPLLSRYVQFKTDGYVPNLEDIPIYKQLGDSFMEHENTIAAREMYDFAASLCDLEAMVKKSRTYEGVTESRIKLLAIAAAGEYKPAKDELKKLKQHYSFSYDEKTALNYYKYLSSYITEPEAVLYVFINKGFYPLEHLYPELSTVLQYTAEELAMRKIDDNLLYCAGREIGGKYSVDLLMGAAMQGNVTASGLLSTLLKNSEYAKYSELLRFNCQCFQTIREKSFVNYLKYVNGENPSDWFDVYLCAHYGSSCGGSFLYDRHDKLIALTRLSNSKVAFNAFKELVKLSDKAWDTDVVSQCRANVPNGKYSVKIIKSLGKLKTVQKLYDVENSEIRKLARKGFFENRHIAVNMKEKLSVSEIIKLTVNPKPDVASNEKSTSGGVSAVPTYYVGQDLGVGYVFYVDNTGQHGLLVSKTYKYSRPGKVNELNHYWGENSKYKWRMPSANELYMVYDKLKSYYPQATYLAQKNPNNYLSFLAVSFNKKRCYNTSVNDAYTYCIVKVSGF